MKIELIKLLFNESSGFKYKPFDYCCEMLKRNPAILLTDEECYEYDLPNFAISETETYSDWEDDWEETRYYPIRFCPFCGTPIEIVLIEEKDVSDFYERLNKKREELWKKCQRTDSKKKEAELRDQVSKLDDRINCFYNLMEYSENLFSEEI